jgi:hypothetical protein
MKEVKSRKDSFISPVSVIGVTSVRSHMRAPSYKEARLEKQMEKIKGITVYQRENRPASVMQKPRKSLKAVPIVQLRLDSSHSP